MKEFGKHSRDTYIQEPTHTFIVPMLHSKHTYIPVTHTNTNNRHMNTQTQHILVTQEYNRHIQIQTTLTQCSTLTALTQEHTDPNTHTLSLSCDTRIQNCCRCLWLMTTSLSRVLPMVHSLTCIIKRWTNVNKQNCFHEKYKLSRTYISRKYPTQKNPCSKAWK